MMQGHDVMCVFRCAALCWVLLSCPLVNAEQRPEVQVGFTPFPGYAYLNEQGELAGHTVDLARTLLDQAGYSYRLRIMPAARIWVGLADGSIHLWSGVLARPEMAEHVRFVRRDFGRIGLNLYARPGQSLPEWPGGLADTRLITVTNYQYSDEIQVLLGDPQLAVQVVQSASARGALEMLLRGRGDYLLHYRGQVDPLLISRGLEPLPSRLVMNPRIDYMLSRQTSYAEQLQHDLESAYDSLLAQGVELHVTRR
ncbi:MAG: hypothetical protein CVV07_02325 [Gammaproteobacteria bacterium HGW-Gammaproteobacteria-11]|nr:MAG: hypothetical protein CVV07_02325 [Gammaproteobacteria bacterium HGW-Gammaproteobacteria-11]